jgi:DNA-binding winged helix-turn-helix (wHTH) protein
MGRAAPRRRWEGFGFTREACPGHLGYARRLPRPAPAADAERSHTAWVVPVASPALGGPERVDGGGEAAQRRKTAMFQAGAVRISPLQNGCGYINRGPRVLTCPAATLRPRRQRDGRLTPAIRADGISVAAGKDPWHAPRRPGSSDAGEPPTASRKGVGVDETVLSFGRWRLLPRSRRLLAGDAPVPLGSRAFDLLLALAEARGALVTKDELLRRVWPGAVVEENNLQVQVSALRKALGDDAAALIATIPGRGYRFTGAVQVRGAVAPPVAPAPGATPPPPAGGPPTVAVLPFANMTSDPEQDYFADGVTEELTTALSHAR